MHATIRSAVNREICRRNLSAYAFAKSLKGKVHPVTIMKWLYSNHRVSIELAEKVLAALDLVIVSKSSVNGGKK